MADDGLRAPPIRDDGLQINEKRDFQRRVWTVERWAWLAFGLVILAATAGMTGGGGYFASTTVKLPAGELRVPHFSRWQAPDELTITFSKRRELHTVLIERTLLDYFQIEQIQPQPRGASFAGNGSVFEFPATNGSGHRVTFHIRPTRPGIARYRAEIDGEGVDLTTIVLP